ncbi:hypothetical protein DFJ73DRAFT_850141 [Zopfochytrium polystomum]|nr:hypothetical protein DFJ73DRAFT_850141 [Zopfochytrium polystomum]
MERDVIKRKLSFLPFDYHVCAGAYSKQRLCSLLCTTCQRFSGSAPSTSSLPSSNPPHLQLTSPSSPRLSCQPQPSLVRQQSSVNFVDNSAISIGTNFLPIIPLLLLFMTHFLLFIGNPLFWFHILASAPLPSLIHFCFTSPQIPPPIVY